MNPLDALKRRFRDALAGLVDDTEGPLESIRPAQDPRFGDYQANIAMPLGKELGRPPRDIAQVIVDRLDWQDVCHPPEIAGPGFINLRLRDEWIVAALHESVLDERLGVSRDVVPHTFVIDYSSPNVAKPMHVGHVRSTVLGDAICRTLRFLGHRVIADNHLGDWGTQFGMIIYGFKHFRDEAAYERRPVEELSRLYKLVNRLVEYHEGREELPRLAEAVEERRRDLARQRAAPPDPDKQAQKKNEKALRRFEAIVAEKEAELASLEDRLAAVEADSQLAELAAAHANIGAAVLAETAALHAGDEQNVALWQEFMPRCRWEIQRIYDRLDIAFDVELGESFYQDRLAAVVDDFRRRGLARPSEGADCVFIDGFDTPMIIRKRDGAFLYATTDLATIQYRMETWHPDGMLYVVDHRQGEHFDKLFAAARLWGYTDVDLRHIRFGTVLGEDGRPFKTRAGDTVGLESLLDEAVRRAHEIVAANDEARPGGPVLSDDERRQVAETVGIGAIKYADLSQNRTSDYVFSYDKMLAMNGNTATYLQYSYARIQNIFAKGQIEVDELRGSQARIVLGHPHERRLAVMILQLAETIDEVLVDFRPNLLAAYLFELAKAYSDFYEACPVLKAENENDRASRLLLCDLAARTIQQGLNLLGIHVVDRM
jgi:arginyl-tRNA synthetase